jgi:site-specific DNA-cytosine methylase
MGYEVLGISSGNGVILYPMRDSVIGNIESRADYYISKKPIQWKLNFPNAFMETGPLPEVRPQVIIGHPKCGISSMLALSRGKSFKSHKGEPSLDLFFQAIDKYNPEVFFLENLSKFLKTYPKEVLKEKFKDYYLVYWDNSVAHWGNSQLSRVRLVLMGIKLHLVPPEHTPFTLPGINLKCTKELLKDLPTNGHFREPLGERIAIYGGRKMTISQIQQFWLKNPSKTRFPTDNHLGSAPGVYRNLSIGQPATVRKGNREFNPQGLPMSPRERARIQGVPDSFLIADPNLFPHISFKTLLNKGRITLGSSPPYEIGLWIKGILDYLYHV